jgi:hypothetical protein
MAASHRAYQLVTEHALPLEPFQQLLAINRTG